MTKRRILINLGLGLVGILAFICFPEIFFFVLFWRHGLLLALFLLLIAGLMFLLRAKGRSRVVDSN